MFLILGYSSKVFVSTKLGEETYSLDVPPWPFDHNCEGFYIYIYVYIYYTYLVQLVRIVHILWPTYISKIIGEDMWGNQ